MAYQANVEDTLFRLQALQSLAADQAWCRGEAWDESVMRSVLEEAARFAQSSWVPTNALGDRQGVQQSEAGVQVPDELIAAYRSFVDHGWNTLSAPDAWGGQAMPHVLDMAAQEYWQGANMALALCPMLTQATIEALAKHGSDSLKQTYLAKLVSGEWTGTMDLTEPQAGSDLSQVNMQAIPDGEHYLLKGQKIYITWGEHNLTDNTIHMVLARLPDAPPGVKGISLFLVPRYLVDDQGAITTHNDLHCTGLEHKLGIHASPTCVMSFGEQTGAVGYLIGEANEGLTLMFTMMNLARLAVGVQALGVADCAHQAGVAYAKTRIQGSDVNTREPVAIIQHPDVKRMLLTQHAEIQAMRALCLQTGWHLDGAERAKTHQLDHQARASVLVPVAKAWCTELAQSLVGNTVQVHGGMGYVEETGVAQYVRDIRITTIYEGTTGIQAQDFVRRKCRRDDGKTLRKMLAEVHASVEALSTWSLQADNLLSALTKTEQALDVVLTSEVEHALMVSVPMLMATGYVLGAHYLIRAMTSSAFSALSAAEQQAKQQALSAYLAFSLPHATAYAQTVVSDVSGSMVFDEHQLAGA